MKEKINVDVEIFYFDDKCCVSCNFLESRKGDNFLHGAECVLFSKILELDRKNDIIYRCKNCIGVTKKMKKKKIK